MVAAQPADFAVYQAIARLKPPVSTDLAAAFLTQSTKLLGAKWQQMTSR
jgi:hypothetical protein